MFVPKEKEEIFEDYKEELTYFGICVDYDGRYVSISKGNNHCMVRAESIEEACMYLQGMVKGLQIIEESSVWDWDGGAIRFQDDPLACYQMGSSKGKSFS